MAVDRRVGEDRREKKGPTKTGFFIYKTDGSIVDVPCPAVVLYNFEQHFKVGVNPSSFAGEQSSTRSLWMAFEAERVVNKTTASFEDWLTTVDSLNGWEEALPLGHRASGSQSPDSALPPA